MWGRGIEGTEGGGGEVRSKRRGVYIYVGELLWRGGTKGGVGR